MSVTFQFLFNVHDGGNIDVVGEVYRALGVKILNDSSGEYGKICGVEIDVSQDHGYQNDGEIYFEKYKYVIRTRTATGSAQFRAIQAAIMASVPLSIFSDCRATEGILVYDLQKVLGKFKKNGDTIQECISGLDASTTNYILLIVQKSGNLTSR